MLRHGTHLLINLEVSLFKLSNLIAKIKVRLPQMIDVCSALLGREVIGGTGLTLEAVKFLLEVVVVLEEGDVLLHDLLVALLEGLVGLGQLARHIVQGFFKVLTLLGGLSM